jgi:hypothetical protein
MGPRRQFVKEIKEKYDLDLALHCVLATGMSDVGGAVDTWPKEACRVNAEGKIIENRMCLGSQQYLDLAEKRLLDNCADGVVFLMFDFNWFTGLCWNKDHGHPVPYKKEDHIRANVELAKRVHEKYPDVLIEMQDMLCGGMPQRYIPVYYKYGIPGSYNETWGFELMWQPMEELKNGHARSLYYYSLGSTVPLYLHIDLRGDNKNCVALWWYASTCRHLGIGGTHRDPAVAQAQKLAMKQYRKLERYYKQGKFYGISEQIHIHVLEGQQAFVVNLFNLSDKPQRIGGTIPLEQMGLDRERWYHRPKEGWFDQNAGTFSVSSMMEPWSAKVIEVLSYKPVEE